jgi:hypothetical protein
MARISDNLEKTYANILRNRQRTVDKNLAEGRTMDITGKAETLDNPEAINKIKDLMEPIRVKDGVATNLENVVKTPAPDLSTLSPQLRNKTLFPSTMKVVGPGTEDPAVFEALNGVAKDSKGLAYGISPMVGLGAAALGIMPIAKKLQNQDFSGAAKDTAEMGVNMAFPVASTVLNSPEAGAAELPPEEMKARDEFNLAQKQGLQDSNPSKFKNVLNRIR